MDSNLSLVKAGVGHFSLTLLGTPALLHPPPQADGTETVILMN